MSTKELASDIFYYIGGHDNIENVVHCSTRLRFKLNDATKADTATLKKRAGIIAVVNSGGQYQVVLGSNVNEVFSDIEKMLFRPRNLQAPLPQVGDTPAEEKPKAKPQEIAIDFLISIFQPLIPAITGAGMLKAMLILLSTAGWVQASSDTFRVLNSVADAVFYFLGLMIAVTTATKLNIDKILAIAAVCPLLLPSLMGMTKEGISVFGFDIENVAYNAQVFPFVLTILFLSGMIKIWTKVSPKVIRGFLVPMLSLLTTVPVSLLVLGPAGYVLGSYISGGVLWLFSHFGWAAITLMAMALPFMVTLGMHKPMIPYVVNQYSTTGVEPFYGAASLAHNISEAGAMFAIALKTKDKEMRAIAFSTGTSALCGISEPALYGVTIQHKKILYSVLFGCLTGGLYVGLNLVTSHVAVTPGIASMAKFVSPTDPMNIVHACIGFAISFISSMLCAVVLWKDKTAE